MLGAPPYTSGPLTLLHHSALPAALGTSLGPRAQWLHHVWQEAQCLLWGLWMVGDRWQGG